MNSDILKACNGGGTPTVDLTQGLIAHYLLNNNADDSYGTYDGTASGGVDFQGDMAKFDGVDDYVKISGYDASREYSQITISAWVEVDTINNGDTDSIYTHLYGTFGIGKDGNSGCRLAVSTDGYFEMVHVMLNSETYTNDLGFGVSSYAAVNRAINTPVQVGRKYHVVGTVNGNINKLYIDGALVCTLTTVQSIRYSNYDTAAAASNRPTITIGNFFMDDIVTSYHELDGGISNIRIYNEAKDQTFIDSLYAEEYYPKPLPLPTTVGLVAHYPLTGTAEDAWGAGGNESGTEYNGVAFVTDVDRGSVASFDGIDDYIGIPHSSPLSSNSQTFSVWLKTDYAGVDYKGILHKTPDTGGSNTEIGISMITGGKIYVNITDNTLTHVGLIAATVVNDNQWHYITVVKEYGDINDTLHLYIDGILEDSLVLSGHGYVGTNEIVIGKISSTSLSTRYWDGEISDVYIYDRALTQTEVTALYNEVNEPTQGLVVHYPLTIESRAQDMWASYNGTEVGGLTYIDDAEFGSVANFDGVDDYSISSKVPTGTGNFTICGWIKKDDTSDGWIINNRSDSTVNSKNEWQVTFYNASAPNLRFALYNSNLVASSVSFANIPIAAHTKWYWFCAEVDGTTINTYTDNVFDSTGQFVGTRNNASTSTVIGMPGWNLTNSTLAYNGRIRDIRIYNRVLTAQEKTDIYNYEKNFRPIDIDDTMSMYLPLSQSALDNYYNQYDATASVGVIFDGNKATIPIGESITYPSMPTTYKTLTYIHDNLFHNVVLDPYTSTSYRTWLTALLDNFNNCTLEEVRTFDTILSDERLDILSKVKGGVIIPEIITASGSWVSPITGTIKVIVIGGGGGGAARDTGTSSTAYYDAGGECGQAITYNIPVVKDQSYTITIGAGGVGGYRSFNTGYAGGGSGGQSSFDTYTANGGGCPYLNLLTSATRNLYRESVRGHIEHEGFIGVSAASRAVAQNLNFVGDAGMGFGVGGGSLNNTYHTSGSARGGAGANGAVIILI